MHLFSGYDAAAKDIDCILIYDEETNVGLWGNEIVTF